MSLTEHFETKVCEAFTPLAYVGDTNDFFTKGHIYSLKRAETAFGMVEMDIYDVDKDQTICISYYPEDIFKNWRGVEC